MFPKKTSENRFVRTLELVTIIQKVFKHLFLRFWGSKMDILNENKIQMNVSYDSNNSCEEVNIE